MRRTSLERHPSDRQLRCLRPSYTGQHAGEIDSRDAMGERNTTAARRVGARSSRTFTGCGCGASSGRIPGSSGGLRCRLTLGPSRGIRGNRLVHVFLWGVVLSVAARLTVAVRRQPCSDISHQSLPNPHTGRRAPDQGRRAPSPPITQRPGQQPAVIAPSGYRPVPITRGNKLVRRALCTGGRLAEHIRRGRDAPPSHRRTTACWPRGSRSWPPRSATSLKSWPAPTALS